ncbi:MAG: family ATPase [Bacteroidetes bacterium]|jgi:predicted ATP-binding protein involved in virulence|nr:family ATPase [Bacteroidota bacterium]
MENFITSITVKESRNVKDLEIPFSEDKRKHLILTGKNGSGKTSLLIEINKYLTQIDGGSFVHYESQKRNLMHLEDQISNTNLPETIRQNSNNQYKGILEWFKNFGGTKISFSLSEDRIYDKCQKGEFILAYFDSKRHTNLTIPTGVKKIDLKKKYGYKERASIGFIQYIVNLKADRSFARDDNEQGVVDKIDSWFSKFEDRLKEIFDVEDLMLLFDRKTYNFDIIAPGKQPFNFNNLSDGYSAIISIVTELLLRMEAHEVKSYDLEGIVIIDEIETHLHVDLQKKILPFLTDFFPRIQFIVTTHSPFVLSSLSNTVICDLESKTVITDLSAYSYDALLESYFNTDKYSEEVKALIGEFEMLINTNDLSEPNSARLRYLRDYFAHTPKYLSKELLVKLQQIELIELNNKK